MCIKRSGFSLDSRLTADCIEMGYTPDCELLLFNNRLFHPWFILVPHTKESELIDLEAEQLHNVMHQIGELSRFVRHEFRPDKINAATIGNVVRQLHIHIVARYHKDPCWPGTVWGYSEMREAYTSDEVQKIVNRLRDNTTLLVN